MSGLQLDAAGAPMGAGACRNLQGAPVEHVIFFSVELSL